MICRLNDGTSRASDEKFNNRRLCVSSCGRTRVEQSVAVCYPVIVAVYFQRKTENGILFVLGIAMSSWCAYQSLKQLALPCPVMWLPVIKNLALPCPVMWLPVIKNLALPCPVMWLPVLFCHETIHQVLNNRRTWAIDIQCFQTSATPTTRNGDDWDPTSNILIKLYLYSHYIYIYILSHDVRVYSIRLITCYHSAS